MNYLIYARRSSQSVRDDPNLPEGYKHVIWKPSLLRVCPKGASIDTFLITWIYFLVTKFKLDDMYWVHLVYYENRLVHHTFVTRPYFKFPFIGINDVQIGQIKTCPAQRKKRLATYILHNIVRYPDNRVNRFFYVCEGSNVASQRLAEGAGFAYEASAERVGIPGIKRYALIADNIQSYSSITERPGLNATREQVQRLVQRYRFAAEFARGKDVLEVACGTGMGLAYIAKEAKSAVGVDIDTKNIAVANDTYGARQIRDKHESRLGPKLPLGSGHRLEFQVMDAHALQFSENCFDIVLLFEGIYYLRSPSLFVSEAYRIMRDNGMLIISSVNKEWRHYHPSPYSYRYLPASELYSTLHGVFRDVSIYAGSEESGNKLALNLLKELAVKLSLIPGSLESRAKLKRLFMGRVFPLPQELSKVLELYTPPVTIPHTMPCTNYKIIYAVARK